MIGIVLRGTSDGYSSSWKHIGDVSDSDRLSDIRNYISSKLQKKGVLIQLSSKGFWINALLPVYDRVGRSGFVAMSIYIPKGYRIEGQILQKEINKFYDCFERNLDDTYTVKSIENFDYIDEIYQELDSRCEKTCFIYPQLKDNNKNDFAFIDERYGENNHLDNLYLSIYGMYDGIFLTKDIVSTLVEKKIDIDFNDFLYEVIWADCKGNKEISKKIRENNSLKLCREISKSAISSSCVTISLKGYESKTIKFSEGILDPTGFIVMTLPDLRPEIKEFKINCNIRSAKISCIEITKKQNKEILDDKIKFQGEELEQAYIITAESGDYYVNKTIIPSEIDNSIELQLEKNNNVSFLIKTYDKKYVDSILFYGKKAYGCKNEFHVTIKAGENLTISDIELLGHNKDKYRKLSLSKDPRKDNYYELKLGKRERDLISITKFLNKYGVFIFLMLILLFIILVAVGYLYKLKRSTIESENDPMEIVEILDTTSLNSWKEKTVEVIKDDRWDDNLLGKCFDKIESFINEGKIKGEDTILYNRIRDEHIFREKINNGNFDVIWKDFIFNDTTYLSKEKSDFMLLLKDNDTQKLNTWYEIIKDTIKEMTFSDVKESLKSFCKKQRDKERIIKPVKKIISDKEILKAINTIKNLEECSGEDVSKDQQEILYKMKKAVIDKKLTDNKYKSLHEKCTTLDSLYEEIKNLE